jgi:thioredoxin-related protein|tara:strand:+ start:372 stop:530 length:159 start_codon:yes stop_codon:yes gene_type:complete
VSINASKQKEHEFIERYNLKNTPTYVLINNEGEKIGRRVGTFYPKYFENKIG